MLRDSTTSRQHELLKTALPSSERVCTRFRGVAAFLGEQSPQYFKRLTNADPLVAYFAECPNLPAEDDQRLLGKLIDEAVQQGRFPWWGVPPRGDIPLYTLHKHRPLDTATFLQPYLSGSVAARLWSTACVASWGGDERLNADLVVVAMDPAEHSEARQSAVKAILQSPDDHSVTQILTLVKDQDDSVRGTAIRFFRETQNPTPNSYFTLFSGGANRKNSIGGLHYELEQYCGRLDENELKAAFLAIVPLQETLGNLLEYALRGLFARAVELGFDAISPALILVSLASSRSQHLFYHDSLTSLLKNNPPLVQRVLASAIDTIDDRGRTGPWRVIAELAACATDDILVHLPASSELSVEQARFVKRFVNALLAKQYTQERYKHFKSTVPDFVRDDWKSAPPVVSDQPNILLEKQRIIEALTTTDDPVQQTARVLEVFADLAEKHDGDRLTPEDVEICLARQEVYVATRVLKAFLSCAQKIRFRHTREGDVITITRNCFSTAVWILWKRGVALPTSILAEWVACYGYSDSSQEAEERWNEVIDYLHDHDLVSWRSCIGSLISRGGNESHFAFGQLDKHRDAFFTDGCRARLLACDYYNNELRNLLRYWAAVSPVDWREILVESYERLAEISQPEDVTTRESPCWQLVLDSLMCRGDDWAWEEF